MLFTNCPAQKEWSFSTTTTYSELLDHATHLRGPGPTSKRFTESGACFYKRGAPVKADIINTKGNDSAPGVYCLTAGVSRNKQLT